MLSRTSAPRSGGRALLSGLTSGGGNGPVSVGVSNAYIESLPNSPITLTGDASGTGANTIPVTLASTGVVAGTYNNVAVNAKGLATGGSNVGYLTTAVTSITAGAGLAGGTITTTGTISVATAGVANAMLANMAANTLKGNNTAGAGAPIDLTVAQTTALLGLGTMSTQNANAVAVAGGTIDGTSVGAATRSSGAFTTLAANGAATFTGSVAGSPANQSVTFSPTGTGTVTVNPATLGHVDNVAVGATTASTGAFTTLSASGTLTLSGAAPQVSLNNATSNWVQWNTSGLAAPANTTRSMGTKLVLYPSLSPTACDYAVGVAAGVLWHSGAAHTWYNAAPSQTMTLDTSGNLVAAGGIAASGNGSAQLAVAASTYTGVYAPDGSGTTAGTFAGNAATPTTYYRNTTHSFGDRTGAATFAQFDSTGTYNVGGAAWKVLSDARLKRNVVAYGRGLAAVLELLPIEFEYNGRGGLPADGRRFVGLRAEDAGVVMPELVGRWRMPRPMSEAEEHDPTEYLSLDPSALIYALVNAVKELGARVGDLERRVA